MPPRRFNGAEESGTGGESVAEMLEQLHRSPPQFNDESLAPEVDRPLLVSLVRQQLSTEDARLAYRLIHTFASWNTAHTEVLAEELRRGRGTATD